MGVDRRGGDDTRSGVGSDDAKLAKIASCGARVSDSNGADARIDDGIRGSGIRGGNDGGGIGDGGSGGGGISGGIGDDGSGENGRVDTERGRAGKLSGRTGSVYVPRDCVTLTARQVRRRETSMGRSFWTKLDENRVYTKST